MTFRLRPGARSAVVLLAVALGGLAVSGCGEREPARRPNVVVVLHDTLRPDHLELYGYERATAPYLAEIGARGAVFTRAYSTSAWTPPSTASVFTGLYPTGHGLVHGFETNQWIQKQLARENQLTIQVATLPADHPTLPERLRAAGYATWGYATNPHISEEFGFERGFDRFVARIDASAGEVADWVIEHQDEIRAADRPYFLYLHLNDVHKPYDPREPWYEPGSDDVGEAKAAYQSEISYLDHELRRAGEALGWDQDTLVVLLSDHGEAFLEHGLFGHGSSLHAELNRVLMVFAGPGVTPGRVEANASLIDVVPTLSDLLGLPARERMDGRSLRPLLEGETRAAEERALADRILFAHRRGMNEDALESLRSGRDLWSVQRGSWRLIRDEVEGKTMLYDHARDPLEQQDLYAQEPERARELEALLDAFRAKGIRKADERSKVMDQELFDELEKLGYTGDDR